MLSFYVGSHISIYVNVDEYCIEHDVIYYKNTMCNVFYLCVTQSFLVTKVSIQSLMLSFHGESHIATAIPRLTVSWD